jgi:DNA-binding transcriptional regulator GbsR (MarR family)
MSNNLADISVFESIQNKAHRMMDFSSSLSVFNATFKIVDKKKVDENVDRIERQKLDFEKGERFLKETKPKLKKLKDLELSGKAQYRDIYDLAEIQIKRIISRSNLKHVIKELAGWGIVVTSTELDNDD